MLKQIEVTNRRSMTLALEVMENDSGYQISDWDGLDPVKATLVSTSFAGLDGLQYQSSRLEGRQLKIKLDLQPDFITDTYTSLRKALYTYFMPKAAIKLRFTDTSGLQLDIDGIVEDHSAAMWEADPTVDISIMCFKPDLIDRRLVTLNANTTAGLTTQAIDYPGDIEVGTVLTLSANRTMTSFSMYNLGEDGIPQQLDFTSSLLSGDVLVVSSLQGNKGITLTRSGVSSSYLYGRPSQSGWIYLTQGINNFRVYSEGAAVPYKLEYMVRYGGL